MGISLGNCLCSQTNLLKYFIWSFKPLLSFPVSILNSACKLYPNRLYILTSILLSNIPRTNINYQNQTAVSYFRYIFSPALHLFKPVLISKPPYVRWPNPHYNLKPSLLLSKMNILSTYIALAALLVSSDKHCLNGFDLRPGRKV